MRRVYDPGGDGGGRRFLADRLWPRGVKKEALRLDAWLRDAAPSAELRRLKGTALMQSAVPWTVFP